MRVKNSLNEKGNTLSSPQAKAERLKRVRNFANLSREEFCKDSNINITTLVSWEVGRFGGLSKKGAANVITRVAKEGVFVTLEWLLYEVGAGPVVRSDYKKLDEKRNKITTINLINAEDLRIIEELSLFKYLNENVIDLIVNDNTMLPHYCEGDYVAGTKRFGEQIKLLIGYDCIVQTVSGELLLRNLQLGPRLDSFNLIATNLQNKLKNSVYYDIKLASGAPVIWHRRKEPVK